MSSLIYPFSFSVIFPMVYHCKALFDGKNAFKEFYASTNECPRIPFGPKMNHLRIMYRYTFMALTYFLACNHSKCSSAC